MRTTTDRAALGLGDRVPAPFGRLANETFDLNYLRTSSSLFSTSFVEAIDSLI